MKVTVVIPVRNAERTLEETFKYLLAVDYPREDMEIILADGGSSDSTVKIIKSKMQEYPFVKLVEVPGSKSPGHARNAALKVAKGEYILFTDGDCAPEPDWIYKLLETFESNEKIGIVGGEVLTLRTDPNNVTEGFCEQVKFLSIAGRCNVTESGYMPKITEYFPHEINGGDNSPFFATANMAVRREAAEDADMIFWDEITGEDVDFNIRVQKAGWRIYFKKEALVRHMHRVSLEAYMKQWYGYGYGHPLLINKHAKKELELAFQIPIVKKVVYAHIPSPIKGIIHIGNFHLMHIFGALFALNLILFGLTSLGNTAPWVFLMLTAIFAALYFAPVLKLEPSQNRFEYAKIRYLSNYSFIKGSFVGQFKFNAISIEPSW